MTLRSWNLRARMSCISISNGVRLNSVGSGLNGCSCTFFSFTPCLSSFISCTHRRAWDGNNNNTHICMRQHDNAVFFGKTNCCIVLPVTLCLRSSRLTQSVCFRASSSTVDLSSTPSCVVIFFNICAKKSEIKHFPFFF